MPPIYDTPILGMTTRPPVTTPVEYGNSASYWVEYPSGLIDVSLSHHLSPSDHWQSNGGTVTHNGSEKTNGARAEPPALGENQADIPITFFLHPDLRDHPTGLKCVDPLLNIVPPARKKGIKVLWVNWGLTEHELKTIPPSLVRGFMKSGRGGFGGQLPSKFGRLLMRGEYNSELYGPLQEEYIKGEKAGTDVWIHKNRMSGLWGYQTALDLWLEENGITTLFFAGVNADQCVLGTLVDAYFRGYNCITLEDAIATTSPEGGLANVLYNAGNSYGFVTNTSRVISALS